MKVKEKVNEAGNEAFTDQGLVSVEDTWNDIRNAVVTIIIDTQNAIGRPSNKHFMKNDNP